jgi:hypothetical protein
VPRPLVLFVPLRRLRPREQDRRRPALAALEARCTKWTRTMTDKDKKNQKHKSPHPVVHHASSATSAGLRLSCFLGRSRLSGTKRTRSLGTAARVSTPLPPPCVGAFFLLFSRGQCRQLIRPRTPGVISPALR